jgi:hypothetical protein
MKRPFSAISESVLAPAAGLHDAQEVEETDMTDVEEHSALEVELDRGDAILDSLKFVKKDRLRWLTQASVRLSSEISSESKLNMPECRCYCECT